MNEKELFQYVHGFCSIYIHADYTKRQYKIISFLGMFDIHGCPDTLHIPYLKDFEQCGISRTKIREELLKLEKLNIIEWDQKEMLFTLNKDFTSWKGNLHEEYSPKRMEQLFTLNKAK